MKLIIGIADVIAVGIMLAACVVYAWYGLVMIWRMLTLFSPQPPKGTR